MNSMDMQTESLEKIDPKGSAEDLKPKEGLSVKVSRAPKTAKDIAKVSENPVAIKKKVTNPRVRATVNSAGKEVKKRGRPRLSAIKMAPGIKPGDILPEPRVSETIDTRPVIWHDLPMFAAKHGRTGMDMMYDFGFNTTYQYSSAVKSPTVVPFDVELLLRLYESSPVSCRWIKPNLVDCFDDLYGDIIAPYCDDEGEEAKIRMALSSRFAVLLGRSTTVSYRWMTDMGESSRRVISVLSKIKDVDEDPVIRRRKFESVAIAAWELRGFDLELVHPIPAPGQLSSSRYSNVSEVIIRRIMKARASEKGGYAGGAFG